MRHLFIIIIIISSSSSSSSSAIDVMLKTSETSVYMSVCLCCTEVLSVCPSSPNATVVIGLTQKGFRPGHEPGSVDKSVGFIPSTGRWSSATLASILALFLLIYLLECESLSGDNLGYVIHTHTGASVAGKVITGQAESNMTWSELAADELLECQCDIDSTFYTRLCARYKLLYCIVLYCMSVCGCKWSSG